MEKIRDNFIVITFFYIFLVFASLLGQYYKQDVTGVESLWKGTTNRDRLRTTGLNVMVCILKSDNLPHNRTEKNRTVFLPTTT